MTRKIDKAWLDELKKRVEYQESQRLKMMEIRENVLDNEKELRSLDSTLKKTTSFMKKVKSLSAATVPQLIDELNKLNLSKFVEEMASGIIETKLKLADIPKVIELCLAIAAKYSNFSEQVADDLPVSSALTPDHKNAIRDLFKGYYDALFTKTENTCQQRNKAMKRVKRQERSRGDAADDEKNALNLLQNELDTLRKMAHELACAIGIKMKALKEEASDDEEDEAANLEMGRQLAEGAVQLWNDYETKAFYEDLIDLREMVPKDLYKDSEQRTLDKAAMAERIEDVDVENVNEAGAMDGKLVSKRRPKGVHEVPIFKILTHQTSEKDTSMADDPPQPQPQTLPDPSEERGMSKWQSFVLDLDHLVSKYSSDQAAVYFVSNLNNKSCRKRLVKLMIEPPPSRMDVLPFYARLVATLENVMPDLTTEIVTQLLDKFRGYIQQKYAPGAANSVKVEVKMVCVMMIAELMKFGVISRAEGLSCLRQLVYDLRGNAVEMTATMMESAGLYLYRHTDSHSKMKRLLEVVKAKRDRMKDQRQAMLIDNAYFTCLPPEDSKEERLRLKLDEEDTPMKRFIRHIVLDINEKTVDVFLKCLRRLDWSDPEISDYAIRYLSSTWLLPIENLQHVASAIAGLCNLQHLEWIGMAVIDATIETIRISLEQPGIFNQWAHSAAVYLAELYSFELCDEDLVLQILYQLISYPEPENSWKDLHRIRMICAVLDIVREFFEKGPGRVKMKFFLIYFHRYYYTKKDGWEREVLERERDAQGVVEGQSLLETALESVQTKFPFEVETAYLDICRQFRRSKKAVMKLWPKSLQEAQDAVEKIEKRFKPELKDITDEASEDDASGIVSPGKREISAIEEDDEEEEEDEGENSCNSPGALLAPPPRLGSAHMLWNMERTRGWQLCGE
uniref:MIF4G domain-containing protein n=1 Tax=Caenorhabditis japonica TaxID=281687 RepID=A0A8R1HIY9_CAEJA